jgi:hypothetical protein
VSYAVAFEPKFRRRLKGKTFAQRAAVEECIQRVANNPWGNQGGLQTKLIGLVAGDRVYYSRIDRANRLTWHMDGTVIVFRNHCFKSVVLRSP